jgi:hypothetical protein
MCNSFGSENHLKLDVKEEESESEEGIERTVMVDLSSSVGDKQERWVIILKTRRKGELSFCRQEEKVSLTGVEVFKVGLVVVVVLFWVSMTKVGWVHRK